jgi:hypothetical protein
MLFRRQRLEKELVAILGSKVSLQWVSDQVYDKAFVCNVAETDSSLDLTKMWALLREGDVHMKIVKNGILHLS